VPSHSPQSFEVAQDLRTLRGEELGEGPTIVLAHGLTATRRYVVHGSKVLPRAGYQLVSYDARGHGESDPAPEDGGYSYRELADDLEALVEARAGGATPLLAGHSMGAQTIAAFGLARPDDFAGFVFIGPVSLGVPYDDDVLAEWDALADGLERGGVEGFVEVYERQRRDLDAHWHDVMLRITRERLGAHHHPQAVAQALREVPRSLPFDGLSELDSLEVPTLVVASHDVADPGHPYAIAEAWADALPNARLISEAEGESPLAWQGGKLSREIAKFCAEPAVAERLGAPAAP
jgi:3-oxoadipate enol-lactonase